MKVLLPTWKGRLGSAVRVMGGAETPPREEVKVGRGVSGDGKGGGGTDLEVSELAGVEEGEAGEVVAGVQVCIA